MNEISLVKRNKVVRLFLRGLSYDEIARQIGIGKGSVVNIIEEFREGDLVVSSDMTEYVDELRKTAVDMKKYDTSISQVMTCTRLHVKLKDMGVGEEKAEQWIDACQEMASPGVSGNELVNAAMELVQLKAEVGLNYEDLITDYKAKRNERDELGNEITQQNMTLAQVKSEHKMEKEKATKELDSMTKAMTTSQELFQKQKDSLKSEFDEYITKNNLSWEQVNLALALFDSEFGKSDTPEQEKAQLAERILHTKSVFKVNKQLEQEKVRLKSEVAVLVQEEQKFTENISKLKELDKSFRESLSANIEKSEELGTGLKSKRAELKKLEQMTSQYTHNLYISRLIIDFLFMPGNLSKYDLDRLVSLLIALRQERLGIEPKRVTGANGEVICECLIPKIYGNIKVSDSNIDSIREKFAHLLTPLVKDKFISRFDYDMAELKHETEVLNAILKERNRHRV